MLEIPSQILTNRFMLRPLDVGDISDRYAGWLRDQVAQQYISAAASQPDLAALQQYVAERIEREDVVFLGIFEKITGLHIGNIKYEPVNSELGYAIMGILIGEPDWRGKGVAAEVLSASAEWLRQHRRIRQILLGVDKENKAAIRAYEKVGFVIADTPYIQRAGPGIETMTWKL